MWCAWQYIRIIVATVAFSRRIRGLSSICIRDYDVGRGIDQAVATGLSIAAHLGATQLDLATKAVFYPG